MNFQTKLHVARELVLDASGIAMQHFRTRIGVETKSDQSPVTIADQATEQRIRDTLAERFPEDAIFGEEFGKSGEGAGTWIIDPIDGTRSFITGLPLFGMLLGYQTPMSKGFGIIYMPALKELYSGGNEIETTLNGAPIRTSACRHLKEARLFINEGDKLAREEPAVFDQLVNSGKLRRMAADCYPHALVASGNADAVVDFDLKPYDFLPVSSVVKAAGGVMTDWQGDALTMNSDGRTLTAATPELHAELVELVNRK